MIPLLLTWLAWPFLLLGLRRTPEPKRLLVIQGAKLGDLICSTPVLAALKRRFPGVYLTVLADGAWSGLLACHPCVDAVLPLDKNAWRGWRGKWAMAQRLRAERFDGVICLSPSLPCVLVMAWARIPWRLLTVPDRRGFTFLLAQGLASHRVRHVPGRQVAATWLALLAPLGVRDPLLVKEVAAAPGAEARAAALLVGEGPWIGVGVSSGNRLKELGVEKLAQVVAGLLEEPGTVVLVGAPAEQALAQGIRDRVGPLLAARVVDGCGTLPLEDLPALVGRFDLYLGVDSGITYMADALGVPVIDVSGPADMDDQRPLGMRVEILQRRELPCVPCSHAFASPYHCHTGDRACIEGVTPEAILAAARRLRGRAGGA